MTAWKERSFQHASAPKEVPMNDEQRSMLIAAGMDVDAALKRFMNNAGLLLKHARRFPDEGTWGKLLAAIDAGDAEGGFAAAHTLKGITANLSFTALHNVTDAMTEDLRAGNVEAARGRLPEATAAYNAVCSALRQI